MVTSTMAAGGRVKSPTASNSPPANSESPAAQAKKAGTGNPSLATPSMKRSLGGIFPMPCASARLSPAKSRIPRRPMSPHHPPRSSPATLDLHPLGHVLRRTHHLQAALVPAQARVVHDVDLHAVRALDGCDAC